MTKILDGKKIALEILMKIKKEIKKRPRKLGLAAILVGDNPISKIYIRQKEKICREVGIIFRLFRFSADIEMEKLKNGIEEIVRDPDNSGIIIQLPLPRHLNSQEILNLIPPEKDIDVLSEINWGRFSQKTLPILPPVVGGIVSLLKKYKIKIKRKNILIVGSGRLVGYPLAVWFLQQNATVSVINKSTKDISFFTKKADILISGAGKPNLIKGKMVKKGVVIIDVGTMVENGKLKGDVDFKSVLRKASYVTPVPGGVGPITVASLLENLIKLSK